MGLFDRVIRVLAACVLLLSLGTAPVTDAVTHGPGALVAEADHAAWHAERAALSQADSHSHHDATDHDHSASVILASQDGQMVGFRSVIELNALPALLPTFQDGPRRPPRDSNPIA